MVGAFYDDMPRQHEKLRQALKDEDSTLIKRQAHRIKGASVSIRANMLADVAQEVEKAAAEGKPEEVRNLYEKVEVALKKALKALEKSGLLDEKPLHT